MTLLHCFTLSERDHVDLSSVPNAGQDARGAVVSEVTHHHDQCQSQHQSSDMQEDGQEDQECSRVEEGKVVTGSLVEDRLQSDDLALGQDPASNVSLHQAGGGP